MPPTTERSLVTVNTPRGPQQVPGDIAAQLGYQIIEPLGGFGASEPIAQLGAPASALPLEQQAVPEAAQFLPDFLGGTPAAPVTGAAPIQIAPPTISAETDSERDAARAALEPRGAINPMATIPSLIMRAAGGPNEEQVTAETELRQDVANDPIAVDETAAQAPVYRAPQSGLSLQPVLMRDPRGNQIVPNRLEGVTPVNREAVLQTLRSVDPGGIEWVETPEGIFVGNNGTALLQSIPGFLNPGEALGSGAAGQRMIFPEAPAGNGQGGVRVEEELELTQRAEIPDAIRALYAQASDKLLALRQESLEGRLDLNRLGAEGLTELAALREAQLAHMQQADAQGAQQLRQRLESVDNTLRAVSESRVDPDGFFGSGNEGFGRRMGAAIAIALGGLGQALAGGPNQALAVVRQRIEDNVRAQEQSIDNRRAVAGMQLNSVSYFRQLLGDERAAREAAMASQWEAALTRIRGTLTNAQSPILRANGNALIVAARAEQLQHLMNTYQNSWEATSTIHTRQFVPQSPVRSFVDQQRQAANPPAQQAPTQQGTQTPQQAPNRPRRPRVQAPGTTPQGQPQHVPGTLPRALTSISAPESRQTESAMRLEQGQYETPGQAPLPTMLEEIVPGAFNRFSEAYQNGIRSMTGGLARLESGLPRLIELARDGVDLRRGEAGGEAAALVEDMLAALRAIWNFGSLTAGERPFLEQIADDPTAARFSNLLIDRPGQFTGVLRSIRRQAAAQLQADGFRIRTLQRVTEGQEVQREDAARTDRTRRMEESNARAERLIESRGR